MGMTEKAARILGAGGIVVIPTDTIYGIVGSAFKRKTVEKIYALRRRNLKKPMIILLVSPRDLARFGIRPDARIKTLLGRWWPGKVSVILPVLSKKFFYLHRGTRTLAFRVPKPKWLRALLQKTGPLVAPSANPEGEPPARTIREAKKYFGDRVALYVGGGKSVSRPSTVVALRNGKIAVLRRGAVMI